MEKQNLKDLERVLDFIPTYSESYNNIGIEGNELEDIYTRLRAAEKGYEQLQSLGVDVADKLRERRFQIANLVLQRMLTDVENLCACVEHRSLDGGHIGDFYTELRINKYLPKLDEYMKKLVPNLDECMNERAMTDDYFPEP